MNSAPCENLKSGWTKVKFGEVVRLCKDRSSDPEADGIERYVGLEHLEPEDLRIRSWGLVADGTTFTSWFKPGQVLFGKRRAYQRKVAVADFEGVCSGDIYVFESADPKQLLPELLPFICQTEQFFNYAVGTSMGSLSPRTNWKHLQDFEIELPPIDEQIKITQVLQELEEANEEFLFAIKSSERLMSAIVEDFLQSNFQKVNLGKLLTDTSYGCSKKANPDETGVPILRIPNVLRDELDLTDLQWISLSETELKRYSVNSGDILLVRTNGNPAYVGRCVVVRDLPQPMVYASYLIRLQVQKETATPDFVATLLNSISVRRILRGDVRSSAGNFNVNTKGIKKQEIPLPPLEQQKALVKKTRSINAGINSLNERIFQTVAIKKKILLTLGSAV